MGEPSRRQNLLVGVVLKGKCAIEHAAEDHHGQKQTGSFHLSLEIGVKVVIHPNSASRLGS